MAEQIILDPAEMASGRTEVDITPWVKVDGVDWGDAEMEAYKAEAQIGESVLDFRLPNRQISMPLVIKEAGGTTFAKARSYIQAKAALSMREGAVGKRVLDSGGTVYFDIVANGLTLGGDWLQANRDVDVNAELRIEAIPDFYEPEELVAEAEEKTATELIKVIPDPGGDMPARVRVVVEEKQGADQKGLIWSFRSRHYSSAETAKVAYEAEELHVLSPATKSALTGASGGTVVRNGTVSTNWTPVLGGRLGGTVFPTHTGTTRIFARVYSTSGSAVETRVIWAVGDSAIAEENQAWRIPRGSAFYVADLGEARLDPPPVGSHRWDWQIQARGAVGNEDFRVDRVHLVNVDDGMGVLQANPQVDVGLNGYAARDEFNHAAGTLSGKTPPIGAGNWAEEGQTGNYLVNATNRNAERNKVSDTTWHVAYVAGKTYSNLVVQAAFSISALGNSELGGGVGCGKRISSSAFVVGGLAVYDSNANNCRLVVSTGLTHPVEIPYRVAVGEVHVIRISFDSSGLVRVWAIRQGAEFGNPQLVFQESKFATGGEYGEGAPCIVDRWGFSNASTRTADSFAAWVPSADASVFASRSAQLTTKGMYRQDSGGSTYGPVSRVVGDLPRLPAGGLEGRVAELFVKGSRGDLSEAPDSSIDDVGAKVYVSRSWLTVPGTI